MDTETLGARVASLVKVAGLDLARVDALAGLADGHTGQIARGKLPYPSADVMTSIARVLGAPVEWFVRGGVGPSERKVRAAVRAAEERFDAGHVAPVRRDPAARQGAARSAVRRSPAKAGRSRHDADMTPTRSRAARTRA